MDERLIMLGKNFFPICKSKKVIEFKDNELEHRCILCKRPIMDLKELSKNYRDILRSLKEEDLRVFDFDVFRKYFDGKDIAYKGSSDGVYACDACLTDLFIYFWEMIPIEGIYELEEFNCNESKENEELDKYLRFDNPMYRMIFKDFYLRRKFERK